MKRTAARIMPTSTATVMSATTVRMNVNRKTIASLRGQRARRAKLRHSPMFKAMTTSTPLNTGKGTNRARGAATSTIVRMVNA